MQQTLNADNIFDPKYDGGIRFAYQNNIALDCTKQRYKADNIYDPKYDGGIRVAYQHNIALDGPKQQYMFSKRRSPSET